MARRRRVRNKRSKNTALAVPRNQVGRALVPQAPRMQRVVPRRNRRKIPRGPKLNMSREGVNFLKCSFCPFDSMTDAARGIPDAKGGKTIGIKDTATETLSFTPAKDTYIVIAPVPGVAYFKCEVDPGEDPVNFVAVNYPSYETNFGTNGEGIQYTQFRYASNVVGLYNMSNFQQFAGAVQIHRVDIDFTDRLYDLTTVTSPSLLETLSIAPAGHQEDIQILTSSQEQENIATGNPAPDDRLYVIGALNEGSAPAMVDTARAQYTGIVKGSNVTTIDSIVTRRIQGIDSIQPLIPRDNYSASFVQGAYSCAIDRESFEWNDFMVANKYVSQSDSGKNFAGVPGSPLLGMGNLNTIVMKISTPEGAVNSAVMKVACCLEMKPRTDSALYQFAGLSPGNDPVAMVAYRQWAESAPVAVPSSENATAWARLSAFLVNVLHVAGWALPGPIGNIASAGADLIRHIQGLTI